MAFTVKSILVSGGSGPVCLTLANAFMVDGGVLNAVNTVTNQRTSTAIADRMTLACKNFTIVSPVTRQSLTAVGVGSLGMTYAAETVTF
jgi:hypothetical protein